MRCFKTLALLAGLLAGAAVHAGTVPLGQGADSYEVHAVADLLEDADGSLTLHDVTRGEAAGRFRPAGDGLFSFGFTDSAYWVRFDVHNPTADVRPMLLVLRSAWMDSVRLYESDGAGGHTERHVGDRQPFAEREHDHPQFLLDLAVPPGQSTYYLRLATRQAFMSPIQLWEPTAFARADRRWAAYFGVLYGVVIVMFLYNGFIWFSIRDRSYLYYCLYLAGFFITNFSYSGFSFQYLWPESPTWVNWSYSSFILVFQLTALLFAMVFLETRERLPRLHRVLQAFLGAMLLTWGVTLVSGTETLYHAAAVYFVFLLTPLVALAGILAWRSGYRAARFYVWAAMASLVGAFISALTVSGFLPYSFASFHAVEFGITADVVLLALALADRIKFLAEQKRAAEQEVVDEKLRATALLEQAKQELEQTVLERTAELEKAKEAAECLARTDVLTGVSNRRNFEEVADQEWARAGRYHQPLALVLFDIDLFKAINDRHGHGAGDQVIRTVAQTVQGALRDVDFVARIGGEEFAVLLPEVDAGRAAVTAERLRQLVADAPADYEGQVLRCTASFGVAQYEPEDRGFQAMLQRADQMMYRSKQEGRNRVSAPGG